MRPNATIQKSIIAALAARKVLTTLALAAAAYGVHEPTLAQYAATRRALGVLKRAGRVRAIPSGHGRTLYWTLSPECSSGGAVAANTDSSDISIVQTVSLSAAG